MGKAVGSDTEMIPRRAGKQRGASEELVLVFACPICNDARTSTNRALGWLVREHTREIAVNRKHSDVPVFVLCGGLGTRLREETEVRPKPMVPVGNRPILWHIMRTYSHHGFRRFILCLGYKAEVIKSYFLNYASMNSDFTVELKTNDLKVHSIDHEEDWQVTLAYTGELTMTGARVGRAAAKYLGDARHFAVTYGDGVTDADLAEEYRFHLEEGRLGTVLGVNPPSRFGELKVEGDQGPGVQREARVR